MKPSSPHPFLTQVVHLADGTTVRGFRIHQYMRSFGIDKKRKIKNGLRFSNSSATFIAELSAWWKFSAAF